MQNYCERHLAHRLQMVCGEMLCGLCYAESLLAEHPFRPAKRTIVVRMKMVPSMSGGYGWVESDPSDPKAM